MALLIVGSRNRLVKLLFSMARENKPSVIFIDEIDALCSPRGEGDSEASRRIKTELLVQMDGVGKDSKGILVLGATNIPWQLDSAIRRRFQRRIHIGLPDAAGRASMFKIAVGDTETNLTANDYTALAKSSEGYSGSDIANVVQHALMRPVAKIVQATHYKEVFLFLFIPSFPPHSRRLSDVSFETTGDSRRAKETHALLARRPGCKRDELARRAVGRPTRPNRRRERFQACAKGDTTDRVHDGCRGTSEMDGRARYGGSMITGVPDGRRPEYTARSWNIPCNTRYIPRWVPTCPLTSVLCSGKGYSRFFAFQSPSRYRHQTGRKERAAVGKRGFGNNSTWRPGAFPHVFSILVVIMPFGMDERRGTRQRRGRRDGSELDEK